MTCIGCGASVPQERRRFCSKSCSDRFYRVQLVPFVCESCGRRAWAQRRNVTRRRYCSRDCYRAHFNCRYLRGPNNGRWRGGRALSYGPGWKEIRAFVRARDKVCRACGRTPEENGRALDVHHLDPHRFSGDNSPDNLIALCRSCHMRADDHGRRGSAGFLRAAGTRCAPRSVNSGGYGPWCGRPSAAPGAGRTSAALDGCMTRAPACGRSRARSASPIRRSRTGCVPGTRHGSLPSRTARAGTRRSCRWQPEPLISCALPAR